MQINMEMRVEVWPIELFVAGLLGANYALYIQVPDVTPSSDLLVHVALCAKPPTKTGPTITTCYAAQIGMCRISGFSRGGNLVGNIFTVYLR
jgi:hypothetical protein